MYTNVPCLASSIQIWRFGNVPEYILESAASAQERPERPEPAQSHTSPAPMPR